MSGFFANGGRSPVDTKLYDLLGVKPNASDAEIKQRYKWLAKQFHPDKNSEQGDKFKEITHAYGILSDSVERRRYDAQGLEGIKRGTAGGRQYAEKSGAAGRGDGTASGGSGGASGGYGNSYGGYGNASGGYGNASGGYGSASGGSGGSGRGGAASAASGFGGQFRFYGNASRGSGGAFGGFGAAYAGYGSAYGGYGAASGGYGAASGGYGAASGGYGAASGGYGAASGGYGAASGGYGAASAFRLRPKGQNTMYTLRVTQEELYNGKTSKLRISKNVICSGCRGVRGLSQLCRTCHGVGRKFRNQLIGPNGIVLEPCSNCNSKGIVTAEKCKKCNGNKTIKATKIVEVKVKPGMRDGQTITLHGEGTQEPGIEPGNVVVVLKLKQNESFLPDPSPSSSEDEWWNGEDGVSSDSLPNM